MDSTAETKVRRSYNRRSAGERVADLERRIAELKAKQAQREKKDDPLVREIPKIQRRLRKFAQLAMNQQRPDVANSVLAWSTQLDRILHAELGSDALVESDETDDGE